jgi:hypothetical protein
LTFPQYQKYFQADCQTDERNFQVEGSQGPRTSEATRKRAEAHLNQTAEGNGELPYDG